jgi:hypothetical protein
MPACVSPSAQQASHSPAAGVATDNVNPDAKVMADFRARVEEYAKLRKGLEQDVPPLKRTDDPAEILQAQKAILAKVSAARAQAKQGDIFTPATRALFLRLLNPVVKGPDGADTKDAIEDDAPMAKDIPFRVNGEYPAKEPLSTVPADVLKALPALPEDIQFRFVGRHLILYDSRPNMIVDFMLNALPADVKPKPH